MSPVVASSVVLSNLAYLAGAVVVMVLLSAIVVLRQRKPRSVAANVEAFHKGLQALAPSEGGAGPEAGRGAGSRPVQIVGRGERTGAGPG